MGVMILRNENCLKVNSSAFNVSDFNVLFLALFFLFCLNFFLGQLKSLKAVSGNDSYQ